VAAIPVAPPPAFLYSLSMDTRSKRSPLIVSLAALGVLAAGTAGYVFIEGWSVGDALYMTVITLATVGYGETHPLSPAGRWFTVALIVVGMGLVAVAVSSGITFLVEGHLGGMLKRRRMKKMIDAMRDHYLICGAGDMAVYAAEEFVRTRRPAVIISNDAQTLLPWARSRGDVAYLEAAPESDEALREAGVERARGAVVVLGNDRDNLFVTLSLRQLNPNLSIVAQAVDRVTTPKLKRAGADEVVSAVEIGGMRIASAMLRPQVVSFLDLMLRDGRPDLRVEQQTIPEGSPVVGMTMDQSGVARLPAVLVLAVRDGATGAYAFKPSPGRVLQPGDTLIVMTDAPGREVLARTVAPLNTPLS